jgi:murein DD-endopeptidase MepM/ murein hydrolase activator NlpD
MTKLLTDFFEKNPEATINLQQVNRKEIIAEIQLLLNQKGFNAGEVDGIVGEKTLKALEKAKNVLSLQYPTLIGKMTFNRLMNFYSSQHSLFLPTNGAGVITSPFNLNRLHPIKKIRHPHRGIDIGASVGTPVFAIADGIVNTVVDFCEKGNFSCGGGFGNYIRIFHPQCLFSESVYAHLESVFVLKNGFVHKGEKIGTVGNTGSNTGPHLHFEIWAKKIAVDPMMFFENIVKEK